MNDVLQDGGAGVERRAGGAGGACAPREVCASVEGLRAERALGLLVARLRPEDSGARLLLIALGAGSSADELRLLFGLLGRRGLLGWQTASVARVAIAWRLVAAGARASGLPVWRHWLGVDVAELVVEALVARGAGVEATRDLVRRVVEGDRCGGVEVLGSWGAVRGGLCRWVGRSHGCERWELVVRAESDFCGCDAVGCLCPRASWEVVEPWGVARGLGRGPLCRDGVRS